MRFSITVATLGLLLAGCNHTKVADPVTTKFGGSAPEQQMDFWHELAERKLTSNDEAFHGILLYLDGTVPEGGYDARVKALKDRGYLPANFDRPADEAATRGTIAHVLSRAGNVAGGVSLYVARATNNTLLEDRYAVRELADQGLFPLSSPNQVFSGTEFVGIMGKFEDYQRGGGGTKTPGGLAK
jgi:hypothetical protein